MGDDDKTKRFESDDRVILVMPKNDATEQRVVVKQYFARGSKDPTDWIDIREWWYKDGPLNEPVHTRRGTMVHREHAPKMVIAILKEFSPEEAEDIIVDLGLELARLRGNV